MGNAPEGEESEDATAGLALTLMDVLLRPVEFFRGTSGLMSAVWNAPTEPVSALQVIRILTFVRFKVFTKIVAICLLLEISQVTENHIDCNCFVVLRSQRLKCTIVIMRFPLSVCHPPIIDFSHFELLLRKCNFTVVSFFFQGNLLLQDHSQKLHLSNGLIVDLTVLGVASIDLSGSISISLWYKNSHSVIKNSGALVVEGSMKLDSQVLKGGIKFSAETEAVIDFQTDVNFSDMPLQMCLQMKRLPLQYR